MDIELKDKANKKIKIPMLRKKLSIPIQQDSGI